MSHKATNWAVSQRGISPVAKVLLWQLADRHNPDNGCFPDQETLARDCEISRATVNRNLLDLEAMGLVKRVVRNHPVTKKRLPTRYVLAFEEEFAAIVGEAGNDDEPVEEPGAAESHVSNCDMENQPSHVSPASEAMSHQRAEPCLTGETHNRSLTGNGTSKITGKRDERAGRESDFDHVWKAFPTRPGSNKLEAFEAFMRLDKVDADRCRRGAERFAQHFREQGEKTGIPAEDRVQYVPYLSNWIGKQGWISALELPVKATSAAAQEAMKDVETLDRVTQAQLFEACEKLRGKPVIPGQRHWSFPKALVEQARERLAQP